MADQSIYHAFPLELAIPNFRRRARLWAFHTRREMLEVVAATEKTIAASKELMAQADRIFAKRQAANLKSRSGQSGM